jgi:hypothetical protein
MVGAISSGMGGIDASALKQMQEKMFKQFDLNGDGKITKEEMNKVVQSDGTQKGPSVDEVFKNLDTDNDGAISKLESDAGLAKLAQQMQGKDGAQDKGPPPTSGSVEGGGKAGASESAQSSSVSIINSSSSSNKVYDKKDANKDGKVSFKEEQDYAMKHPDDAKKSYLAVKNGPDKTEDVNGNQESQISESVNSFA